MTASEKKELRKGPRVPVEIEFKVKTSEALTAGKLHDLSELGATFESEAVLRKNQAICLELPITISLWATVVNTREQDGKPAYGIRFQNKGWLNKYLIKNFVGRYLAGKREC